MYSSDAEGSTFWCGLGLVKSWINRHCDRLIKSLKVDIRELSQIAYIHTRIILQPSVGTIHLLNTYTYAYEYWQFVYSHTNAVKIYLPTSFGVHFGRWFSCHCLSVWQLHALPSPTTTHRLTLLSVLTINTMLLLFLLLLSWLLLCPFCVT